MENYSAKSEIRIFISLKKREPHKILRFQKSGKNFEKQNSSMFIFQKGS